MSDLSFENMIGADLAQRLAAAGIKQPTAVQLRAIPLVLQKMDLMVQSSAGTGKTLAYLLPIFSRLDPKIKGAQAIVAAPTHELCAQIAKVAQGLAAAPADVALLVGTAGRGRQLEVLKTKPKVVVGSVGRIAEFVAQKKLSVHNVKTLVFDEGDKMFAPENIDFVRALAKSTLAERQVLLFSASVTDAAARAASELMKNPHIIRIDEAIPPNISHYSILTRAKSKFDILRKLVHATNLSSAIVFVNRPYNIEKTAARLNFHKLAAVPLYAAAEKSKRKQAIADFTQGRTALLVASDIGSRGLDIPNLQFIVNLDMPESEKDYLHRAGRCGRMGGPGAVFSIITPQEADILDKYVNKLAITVERVDIAYGQLEIIS